MFPPGPYPRPAPDLPGECVDARRPAGEEDLVTGRPCVRRTIRTGAGNVAALLRHLGCNAEPPCVPRGYPGRPDFVAARSCYGPVGDGQYYLIDVTYLGSESPSATKG
jgi:hypothetical protein